MKARKVRKLDPDGTLADNAQRIIQVRLAELWDFMPKVRDPAEQVALHDMRIAAKRLRYALEVTAELFGPYTEKALRHTRELQALLGDIHDCDEHGPRVAALIATLRAEDVAAVRAAVPIGASDLPSSAATAAPHADAYAGLEALSTHLAVRREVLFARFLATWVDLERKGFRPRLEYAIGERPEGVSSTASVTESTL